MVPADRIAPHPVNLQNDLVTHRQFAVFHMAKVEINAVRFLGVGDGDGAGFGGDHAGVAYLTAAFAIEGRAVGDEREVSFGDGLHRKIILHNAENRCFGFVFGVARKAGLGEARQQGFGSL